jgi:hypothetical protein
MTQVSDLVLPDDLRPSWFQYPRPYLRLAEQGLIDINPWFLLENKALLITYEGIKNNYPSYSAVPFARRLDNDDVACWVQDSPGKVCIIHIDTSPGWERRRQPFDTFWDWFLSAIDDMIFHEP